MENPLALIRTRMKSALDGFKNREFTNKIIQQAESVTYATLERLRTEGIIDQFHSINAVPIDTSWDSIRGFIIPIKIKVPMYADWIEGVIRFLEYKTDHIPEWIEVNVNN